MDIKKNLPGNDGVIEVQRVISMLLESAMANSLGMIFEVLKDDNRPLVRFSITNQGESKPLITAQARTSSDDIIKTIIEMMNGKMVTEVFPPSMLKIGNVEVNYWKRLMVTTQDITEKENPGKSVNMAVWGGYNAENKEVFRIPEGSPNPEAHMVEFFRVVQMGAMGTVVIPMRTDRVIEKRVPPQDPLAGSQQMPSAGTTAMATSVAVSMMDGKRLLSQADRYVESGAKSRLDHVPTKALRGLNPDPSVQKPLNPLDPENK